MSIPVATIRHTRDVEFVEPGFRVHHVTAGPATPLDREGLTDYVGEFTDTVKTLFRCSGTPDAIHANYWLSGLAGHRLKHELNIPLIMTFHTLERVKADTFEAESDDRAFQEAAIVACADAVLASCDVEAAQFASLYNADPSRVHVVPLGVEHAFFAPGLSSAGAPSAGARPRREDAALRRTPAGPEGRGPRTRDVDRASSTRSSAPCSPSSEDHRGPRVARRSNDCTERVAEAGVIEHVMFVAPQHHRLLSTWMRAADVTLVPSRAESFGLVALESSACGTPVVASDVGGLTTLIEEGVTGISRRRTRRVRMGGRRRTDA